MKYLSLWPHESNLRSPTAFDIFKQFDGFLQDFDGGSAVTRSLSSFYPALDIQESDENFKVSIDVPGIKKEDIKIEVRDQTLFVSGERKREEKSEKGISRFERSYGQFTRALQLPRNVDSSKIEAQYTDGVLTLTVPKSADAQPRLIDIK